VEFIVAEVEGRVDGFEGFEIDVEFALFALVCDDFADILEPLKEGGYPQKTTRPLGGTRLYNLSLC